MTLQDAKDQVYKKHFAKNGEMWMPTRFQYSKMDNEAAELYAESKAKDFAEWLHDNRWLSFSNGKWNYYFEQGTAMSDETYERNYRKTTHELYEKYQNSQS